jgi:ribose/xylose/arabinose/galactoside ABC-type transport system permease subunit
VLVFLLVLGAGQVLLRRTRFGLHLYAVGGNDLAARLSGIDVDGVRLATFTISGFRAGLSGQMVIKGLAILVAVGLYNAARTGRA